MPKKIDNKILRIIDANYNRLKEGLRVCEDICRFILDDAALTSGYKNTRHKAQDTLNKAFNNLKNIIASRDIIKDVGKASVSLELKREKYSDILFANIQRVKESLRVIEEFNKLINKDSARKFKALRYKVYDLEKKTLKRISSLRHH